MALEEGDWEIDHDPAGGKERVFSGGYSYHKWFPLAFLLEQRGRLLLIR